MHCAQTRLGGQDDKRQSEAKIRIKKMRKQKRKQKENAGCRTGEIQARL
jgi:hypothetical protein